MFAIIGIVVVIGAVLGGYLMEHGNLGVIFQPAEMVIIFGSAIGSFLVASPSKVVGLVFGHIAAIFSGKARSKADYLELLSLMNRLFMKIRKDGLISIEADIETPAKSPLFSKYKSLISNHKAVDFICDNLKVIISSNMPPHEMDNLMDVDIEAHQHETMIPSLSVAKVADSLPGFGIVAAVLGVVLTMGKIDQPPAVLGQSIGAALGGTFLGVFMCYGFVGPMAANLEHQAKEDEAYYHVIKVAMVAFVGGAAPQLSVEFGRRAIPGKERPTFNELETFLRK
ncbi:MAG: flagellar motor stator protein MotA [Deltaproteobacteria bacterium]|nr:flagellar motor stator protein MotA [Deltaproteobacteria bacterium]